MHKTKEKIRFTRTQISILFASILAYTAAYVGRTNLSMALSGLLPALVLTNAEGGMLSTAFAITYAVGQVVNGVVADRVEPRLWIVLGLAGSAACNALVGFAQSYSLLVVAWGLNGAFQSMLWSPIVTIVAANFEGERQTRAGFLLSLTLVFGYLIAWSLSGAMTAYLSWRWAFGAPAIVLCACAALVALLFGVSDMRVGRRHAMPRASRVRAPIRYYLLNTGILFLFAGAVFVGFVRDGIMNWAPTILAQSQGVDLGANWSVMLVLPAINSLGILFGKACFKRMDGNGRRTLSFLMLLATVATALLLLFSHLSAIGFTLIISLCAATMYAAYPIVTTMLPMEYAGLGWAGSTSGLIDGLIYLGSGLAGVFTGLASETLGWNSVYISWIVVSLIGVAAFWLSSGAKYRHALQGFSNEPTTGGDV